MCTLYLFAPLFSRAQLLKLHLFWDGGSTQFQRKRITKLTNSKGHIHKLENCKFTSCHLITVEEEVCVHPRSPKLVYKTHNSGRAFLDKNITVEEDIIVLEELGRLALECTEFGGYGKSDRLALKAMELHRGNEKPVMCEVVQNLKMIMTSWKKRKDKGAAQVTGRDQNSCPRHRR